MGSVCRFWSYPNGEDKMILDFLEKKEHYFVIKDLGPMSPLKFAQFQQWHDVFIPGPTRNVVGISSNDFPGLYYYNPMNQMEYVFMIEGKIDWNNSRFERRIVQIEDDKAFPYHLVIGLFSNQAIDKKSFQVHSWSHERAIDIQEKIKKSRDIMPDQWEALTILIRESFNLIKLPDPGPPSQWDDIAKYCFVTLNSKKSKFQSDTSENTKKKTLPTDSTKNTNENILLFFKTFDSNESTYGINKPSESKKGTHEIVEPPGSDKRKREGSNNAGETYQGTAELICQAGLSSALLDYARINGNIQVMELGRNLTSTLHLFYDENTGIFQNTYPPKGEEWLRGVVDTWYTFHNLYHVLKASHLAKNEKLKELALSAVDRVIAFVRACHYQIPLFAKFTKKNENNELDGSVIGYALNPSVLGMYANVLCHAGAIFNIRRNEYENEAKLSLEILRRWPFFQLFHQTVQLSWAASACNYLGLKYKRDDFTRLLLLNCYRQGEVAGLFQGCTGLGYPAFRETVEAIVPWGDWINDAPKELLLDKIINIVLDKAKKFIAEGLQKD